MHCNRFIQSPLTRRDMLLRCANGFGAVALAALLAEEARAASALISPRFTGRAARNVIFLYMDGGPSQVDTFDYKPLLEKYHGHDPHTHLQGRADAVQQRRPGHGVAVEVPQARSKRPVGQRAVSATSPSCIDDLASFAR